MVGVTSIMSHGSASSLWMGDLDPNMDENYLEQLYKGWGYKVVSVRMIRDRATGKPQGYCFLDFESKLSRKLLHNLVVVEYSSIPTFIFKCQTLLHLCSPIHHFYLCDKRLSDGVSPLVLAQEVLVALNLKPWPGTNKLIKLNWASGSNKGGGGGGNVRGEDHSVYVGDLSQDVDDNAMFKFFASSYPSCRGAKVVTGFDGGSKGFGFVRFTNEDDARAAIANMNQANGLGSNRIRQTFRIELDALKLATLDSQLLIICRQNNRDNNRDNNYNNNNRGYHGNNNNHHGGGGYNNNNNHHNNNNQLDPNMDENYLEQLYKGWGYKVVSVRMIRDRATGKPQGYCFLDFESEQMAQEVLVALNLKPWPGTNKLIKLNWASGSNKGGGGGGNVRGEDHSVYVGDLSQDVDDNAMFKFFASSYPSCRGAKVVTGFDGGSKGFGFVRFTNEDDARAAIANMNQANGLGSNRIRVCKAYPKGQNNRDNNRDNNYNNNNRGYHGNNNNHHGGGGYNNNNNHHNNNNQYGGGHNNYNNNNYNNNNFNNNNRGGHGGGGDAWQQYHQQMEYYNQQVQQYQQEYTEALETEPHGDVSVAEQNAEYLKYDKV
eukprot:sb/3463195/